MGRIKKLLTLILSVAIVLVMSVGVFAAEINKEERRILNEFKNEPFASHLDKKYVNQFENFFSTEYVDIEKESADVFLKNFSKAILASKDKKGKIRIFGQSSQSIQYFQKAGDAIGMYLEYDSNTNDYYAVDKDGYIVMDPQKIVKDTGDSSNSGNTNNKAESKSWSFSIELIFVFVIFLCFLGFLINAKKWVRKIRKHSDKNYDDEEDEMEVANRKTRRARLQTFSYKNFKQVIKYFYVPIIMGVVIVLALMIVYRPYTSLYNSIKAGFIQELSINTFSEEIKTYEDAPLIKDAKISGENIVWPRYSDPYGTIKCDKIGLNATMFMGDSDYILSGRVKDKVENDFEDEFTSSMGDEFKGGAGTYLGSSIPGDGKTILVGAHDTTHFKALEKVQAGMVMEVNTSYARYKYKVREIRIYYAYEKDEAYDLNADKETLVLYTCYPFGKLKGDKSRRMFVYLDKIFGPSIDKEAKK